MQEIHRSPASITTVTELLKYRARDFGDSIAYRFLLDGEAETRRVTYRELEAKAGVIAARMRRVLQPGDRALLLYGPGIEFVEAFFACALAGIIAVPISAARIRRDRALLKGIFKDAGIGLILGTSETLNGNSFASAHQEILDSCLVQNTDEVGAVGADEEYHVAHANDIALLQYTSGSTSNPKGVMVTHGNLLTNGSTFYDAYALHDGSVMLSWLPHFHDMGLIGKIFQALYAGIPCILMPPAAFIQKPVRWLTAVSRNRVTISGAPNFAYDYCVKKIKDDEMASLDLSSWDKAFNGSEPVRASTLDQFYEKYKVCGLKKTTLYPCYGLAEATLFVTAPGDAKEPVICNLDTDAFRRAEVQPIAAEDKKGYRIVSCGHTWGKDRVRIVDPVTRRALPENSIGEIWLDGPSKAAGYWCNPELTKDVFEAGIIGEQNSKYLRTGDLGFRMGEDLFITGRLKDMMICRGENFYPQDIENLLEQQIDELKASSGAAFTVTIHDEEEVIIVYEVTKESAKSIKDTIFNKIIGAVSETFQLSVYDVVLVKPTSIPKTTSGKIQRRKIKSAYLDGTLTVVKKYRSRDERNELHVGENRKIDRQDTGKQAECGRDAKEMLSWLRDYARSQINSRLIDERRCLPPSIVLDLGNHGVLGMQVPRRYGGQELSYGDTFRVFEQLGAIDLTIAAFVGVNHALGTRPIVNFANQGLRDEVLPEVATGRKLLAFGLTEAAAGSNPLAIEATALHKFDGSWHLNGSKCWIGSAGWAHGLTVFAHTSEENSDATGVGAFFVPRGTMGLDIGPEALTMGMRGMVQNSVNMRDVFVGDRFRLGELHAGMAVVKDAIMFGRATLCAISVGAMKRCSQLMLRYASQRNISTGRLLDNIVTRQRLSKAVHQIDLLEKYVYAIADFCDKRQSLAEDIYIVGKIVGPESLWRVVDDTLQLLGGRGYMESNMLPQIFRDARLLRIFEGPTEALKSYLGSRYVNKVAAMESLFATLNANDIFRSLVPVTDRVREIIEEKNKSAPSDFMQDLYWEVADIVCEAIVLAVYRNSYQCSQATLSYQEQKLEHVKNKTLSRLGGWNRVLDLSFIEDAIDTFHDDIDMVDQTSPGEDWMMDDYIVARDKRVRYTSIDAMATSSTQVGVPERSPMTDEVTSWITNWMSKRLRIRCADISSTEPFSSYGIDSVTAVELIEALSNQYMLSQELEPTALWRYPNIDELVSYIVRINAEVAVQKSARGQKSGNGDLLATASNSKGGAR